MTAGPTLFTLGLVLILAGPRLGAANWMQQAPRLAIWTWQAVTVASVAAFVLGGVTLLIPVTELAGGLGAVVHACALSIASAYGASEFLPGRLVGTLLAFVVPAWIAVCGIRVLSSGWGSRRRLRRSLRMVTRPDAGLGVDVLETDAPAAFCVPGRGGRIVVTSGALERLSHSELAGVLAHEAAHLRGRHNLAVALSRTFATAFPFVPLFRAADAETRQLIELLADDVAARGVDRVSLASAIVSLAEMKAPAAAMAMAGNGAVLRVNRLLAQEQGMTRWRYRLHSLVPLALVAGPVLVAGYPTLTAALNDLCAL